MQAVVWHARGDVRVEEWPEPPPPPPGWVTVRVHYCGICGTDVEEWRSGPINIPVGSENRLTGRKAPLVMGHEWTGRVSRVGDGVANLKVGDRVAADTLVYCGLCPECLDHRYNMCAHLGSLGLSGDGGMAAWVNAPASSLWPVPDTVSDEAAAMAEPLAVAIHALRRADIGLEESVLVTGAGAVGLFAIQAARAAGAFPVFVSEPHGVRKRLADRLGAVVLPQDPDEALALVREETRDRGVHAVIECSGKTPAFELGVAALRPRGRIVLVGFGDRPVSFDPIPIQFREIEVLGSLSHVVDTDFASAIELLAQGRVTTDGMLSCRIPVERAVNDGFVRLAQQGQEDVVKILIDLTGPVGGDDI